MADFWIILVLLFLAIVCFCVFFDQALLNRNATIYRVKTDRKRIALTFDDGPSPIWTPKILDELKKANVKATFFMIGHHVKNYPDVARRVAQEGHTIGNHGYAHSVLLYYTPAEIEEEIKYTELVIRDVTGQTTKYFRPPKSWILSSLKDKIKSMGYGIVLWSLNSKDWVSFPSKYISSYIIDRVRPGDILLFHDSGNVFTTEGGDRSQTLLTVSTIMQTLKDKGYEFVTINELLAE